MRPNPTWPEGLGAAAALALMLVPLLAGAGREAPPPVVDRLVLPIGADAAPSPAAARWRRLEPTAAMPLPAARAAFWGLPVDLNEADLATLVAVRGVGPSLAAALLAAREAHGGFRSWREVDAVRGVGPALLARLQASFTLAGGSR